jgi:hypothetical protein
MVALLLAWSQVRHSAGAGFFCQMQFNSSAIGGTQNQHVHMWLTFAKQNGVGKVECVPHIARRQVVHGGNIHVIYDEY